MKTFITHYPSDATNGKLIIEIAGCLPKNPLAISHTLSNLEIEIDPEFIPDKKQTSGTWFSKTRHQKTGKILCINGPVTCRFANQNTSDFHGYMLHGKLNLQ